MNRAILLPVVAALASGCYVNDVTTCDVAPALNVYWRPSPSPPQAGFQVPGLTAAGFPAQLDCADAGVSAVRIFVGALQDNVPCLDGPSRCIGADWRCDLLEGGITIPLQSGGTYDVVVEGRDPFDNLKYRGQLAAGVPSCADVSVGAFPQGVAGPLDLQYSFLDGSNLCAGASYLWFRVLSGTGPGVYDFVDDQNLPVSLPCTNAAANRSIPLVNATGGTLIPAGVYTRDRFEEVVASGPTYTAQRANCALETIVHAGPESWPVVAGASSQLCP